MRRKYDVEINRSWCKRCGLCYWICPTGALTEGELKYPIVADAGKCIGCMMCENVCPEMAVDVVQIDGVKREV